MKQICTNCGELIIGRIDKKFCCDQCRNTYNNRIKRQHEKLIIDTNKILRKNRQILKQFNPEGKTTIRKEYLDKMGFDYRYHTHDYVTKHNNIYKFCYEYGYMNIDDDKVLIVNWQPYM
ncbi:MAG: hypothetical protein B6I18_06220 [Bacteroidetes bacterium 4572_112]|nr:MAG: hypothetical protein B6I18_06220 [Bacteroidetes bacterium 4572_112]